MREHEPHAVPFAAQSLDVVFAASLYSCLALHVQERNEESGPPQLYVEADMVVKEALNRAATNALFNE